MNLKNLKNSLKVVCYAIDEDLQKLNAEKCSYNHPLNNLLLAVESEDLPKIKELISHVVPSYFGRGERITGYLQAGVISVQQVLNLQEAISQFSKSSKTKGP